MLAIALVLTASALWAIADFLAGLIGRRVPLLAVIAVSQVAGLVVPAAVLAARDRPPPDALFALDAAAFGVFSVAGVAALYRGLARGLMGVVAPIAATETVIPVLFGVFHGERPSTTEGVGMGLAVLGIVLAARERGGEQTERGPGGPGGVAFALAAAVCFGFALVALAQGSAHDPYWTSFVGRATAVCLALTALRTRSISLPSKRVLAGLVVVGTTDMAGVTMFSFATTRQLLSVVAVLGSLYPVGVIALARICVGERLSGLQKAGAFAACAGAVIISAG